MTHERFISRWHVWYDDGEVYSSTEWQWEEIPQHGIVVTLVLFDDGTRELLTGGDLYFKFGELLQNDQDRDGLLRKFPNVKFGTWVQPNEYRKIWDKADTLGKAWHQEHGNQSCTNR